MPSLVAICMASFSLWIVLAAPAWAAWPPPQGAAFHALTAKAGLPESEVTTFLQDSQGLMWIGTVEGLMRYDGYKYTLFEHDPLNNSTLSNNHVSSLAMDAQGRIWVGARGGGACRFDPATETFDRFADAENSPARDEVSVVFVDSKNRAWVGGPNPMGLLRFEEDANRFVRVELPRLPPGAIGRRVGPPHANAAQHRPPPPRPGPHAGAKSGRPKRPPRDDVGPLQAMLELDDGSLLIAADHGMVLLDPETGEATLQVLRQGEYRHGSVLQDDAGQFWVCGLKGVYAYDPATGEATLYNELGRDMLISNMAMGPEGRLWMTTLNSGVHVFDPNTRRFVAQFTQGASNNRGLLSNRGVGIYLDAADTLWIATNRGVNLYSPLLNRFAAFHFRGEGPEGAQKDMAPPSVQSMTGAPDGTIWVGAGRSLQRLHPDTGEIDIILSESAPFPRRDRPFHSLLALDNATMWIAAENPMRLDVATGRVTPHLMPSTFEITPPSQLRGMALHPEFGLLVGGTHSGLHLLDPHTGEFLRQWRTEHRPDEYLPTPEPHKILSNRISALLWARDGKVYIGYAGFGFSVLTPGAWTFEHFPNQRDGGALPMGVIWDMLEDADGKVWMATGSGLARFDPATGERRSFTKRDGLPGNSCRSLEQDRQGSLWVGTNAGLCRFNPVAMTFRTYDIRDGLADTEFLSASWQSPGGVLYFGGVNGVSAFDPETLEDNDYAPPVVVTGVSIFNKDVAPRPGGPLETAPSLADKVVLQPGMEVMSFEFAALNYLIPEKNRYRYRLVGLEEDWNTVEADRRFATYSHLPPGEYAFEAQGSNNDGLWSHKPATIRVIVLPYWWETTSFRLVAGFGALGLAFLVFRVRLNIIRRQKLQLEALVAERTEELADVNSLLQTSEENYRNVSERASDGIVIVRNERILYANPQIAAMLRASVEALVGEKFTDFVIPELRRELLQRHDMRLGVGQVKSGENGENGQPGSQYEAILQGLDGSHVDVEINASLTEYEGAPAILGIIRDISERKRILRELEQAKDSADAANQAKSVFLANMSHELRTPLNAILGFAQLMDRAALPSVEQEHLDIIVSSGGHLLTLINQVLDLSKIEAGHMSVNPMEFDLPSCFHELKTMLGPQARAKGLSFTITLDEALPRRVMMDGVKFRQICINLLSNAIKFTEQGAVSLSVRRRALTQEELPQGEALDCVGGRDAPEEIAPEEIAALSVTVRDTGVGIAEEDRPLIFQSFGQTEQGRMAKEGTGLGLPISRRFAQMMGGDITVVSQPGHGSTFRLHVLARVMPEAPAAFAGESRRAVAVRPATPHAEFPPRLLLVDDKSENLLLLQRLFAPLGFALRMAEDGLEAVEEYKRFAPHAMLLDMRMPKLNGFGVVRRVKALQKEGGAASVIIALTASSYDDERQAILDAGCDDFITKPFLAEELIEAVGRHLDLIIEYAPAEQPAQPPMTQEASAPAPPASPLLTKPEVVEDKPAGAVALDRKSPRQPALEDFESWDAESLQAFRAAVAALDVESALAILAAELEKGRMPDSRGSLIKSTINAYRFDLLQSLFNAK